MSSKYWPIIATSVNVKICCKYKKTERKLILNKFIVYILHAINIIVKQSIAETFHLATLHIHLYSSENEIFFAYVIGLF